MPGKKIFPKLIGFILVVLVVIFIVNQPSQAADTTSQIGAWIADAGNGLGTFLTSLVN